MKRTQELWKSVAVFSSASLRNPREYGKWYFLLFLHEVIMIINIQWWRLPLFSLHQLKTPAVMTLKQASFLGQ